jgi:nitrite reductase/ring-hydroxylating ferredoxin subunit
MPANTIKIASVDEWEDGHAAPVEVCGHRVAVFRVEGSFYALDDHCPHQGSTLALGTVLEGCLVECPRHEYVWRITDGLSMMGRNPVPTFKVWMDGGDVMMKIPDPWPEPAHWKGHPKREELAKKWRAKHGME